MEAIRGKIGKLSALTPSPLTTVNLEESTMAVEDITTKRCNKCGDTKPVGQFHKDVTRPDGVKAQCKACVKIVSAAWLASNYSKAKEKTAKWRKENPEKARAHATKYRTMNPEKRKAGNAAWRAANRDKKRVDAAAWYAANADQVKERSFVWAAAHPEKKKASYIKWYAANPEISRQQGRIHAHNRRARERENGGKLSVGLTEKLHKLQRGKCACGCKQPLGDSYHLDHRIPVALGGANEDWNMQLLRVKCNLQKHAKHPVDFMQQRGFLI